MDFMKLKGVNVCTYRKLLRTEDLSDCARKSYLWNWNTSFSLTNSCLSKKGAGNRTMYQWYYENFLTISGDDNDFVNLLLVKLQVLWENNEPRVLVDVESPAGIRLATVDGVPDQRVAAPGGVLITSKNLVKKYSEVWRRSKRFKPKGQVPVGAEPR